MSSKNRTKRPRTSPFPLPLLILFFLFPGAANASQAQEATTPKPDNKKKTPTKSPFTYTFAKAGYRLSVPKGYEKVSHDSSHQAQDELAPLLIPANEKRNLILPAAYFRKIRDTASSELAPPTFRINFTDVLLKFSETELTNHGTLIAKHLSKPGPKIRGMKNTVHQIQGKTALRTDISIPSGKTDTRMRTVFLIPGKDRTFEVSFHYDARQQSEIARDMDAVLGSFAFEGAVMGKTERFGAPEPEATNATGTQNWTRIAYWTGGGFLAGLILHFLLRLLRKKPTEMESKHA